MNSARISEQDATSDESLWLELSVDGEAHTFELGPDETRAVAVGSLLRADLRIDRPGVAPVHFHIEREDDALWIVPAYNALDLRVNAARLTGPRRIDGRSIIEFANARIDARLVNKESAVMRISSVEELSDDWVGGSESQAASLFNDVARVAAPCPSRIMEHGAILTAPIEKFISPNEATLDQPTQCFAPMYPADVVVPVHRMVTIESKRVASDPSDNDAEDSPDTLRTGEHPIQAPLAAGHSDTILGMPSQDTIEMAPFWMTEMEPQPEDPADAQIQDSAASEAVSKGAESEGQMFATQCFAPLSLETMETTCFGPLRSDARHVRREQVKIEAQRTTELDVPFIRNRDVEAHGWLARLGILSKRRPVLVWLVGTIAVFVLSAAVTLTTKHFHSAAGVLHRSASSTAKPALSN